LASSLVCAARPCPSSLWSRMHTDHTRLHQHCALRPWAQWNAAHLRAVHARICGHIWVGMDSVAARWRWLTATASSWPLAPPFEPIARPLSPQPLIRLTTDPWYCRASSLDPTAKSRAEAVSKGTGPREQSSKAEGGAAKPPNMCIMALRTSHPFRLHQV